MEIAQWTSDVRHLPGKLNWVADSLSRPENVPLGTAHTLQTDLDALEVTGGFQTADVWDIGETAEGSTPADGATGNERTADVWTADVTPADGATVEDEAVTTVFSTVDHAALAKAQAASPEVQDHLAGRHPDGVTVKWIEFIP